MFYPVIVARDDNDTFLVTFPDVPEAITFGADEEEALERAGDALETALSIYIQERRDLPRPSAAEGRPTVAPTLLGSLKIALYLAMRAREWRKADLARALNVNARQADRLLDLRHASTVAQLEAALAVCGIRAEIETRELEVA